MRDASPSLEYAAPPKSRRVGPIIALVISAIAVGVMAHLCWNKFAGPVRDHLTRLSLQRELAAAPSAPIDWKQPAVNAKVVTWVVTNAAFFDRANRLASVTGWPCYQGWIGEGESRRFIAVSIHPTSGMPVSTGTLVVKTLSAGSLFNPIEQTRDTQILHFATFQSAFHLNAPALSPTNPAILVLSGSCDDVPFRFELSLTTTDNVNLAEDRTWKTKSPD